MEMLRMFKKNKPRHNESIFIINVSKMPEWNVWTMKQIEKDTLTMAFNDGQISLIENVQSTNYEDLKDLLLMLKVWSQKLQEDNKILDSKYGVKNW